MAKRSQRPPERLRESAWTSAADLEETISAMFHTPKDKMSSGVPLWPMDTMSVRSIEVLDSNPHNNNELNGRSPNTLATSLPQDPPDTLTSRPPAKLTGGRQDILTTGAGDILTAGTPDMLTRGVPDILTVAPAGAFIQEGSDVEPPPVKMAGVPSGHFGSGPWFETADGELVEAKYVKPYDSRNMQSAHTAAEHLAYTTMWKMLGAAGDDAPSREGRIRVKLIAEKTGRSFRQARRLLRSLELKLAVEVTEQEIKEESEARGYRVWGMGPINERRRAGGWNYIYRKANALTLARLLPPDEMSSPPPDNLTVGANGQHDRRALVSLAGPSPVKLAADPPDKLTGKDFIRNTSNKEQTTTTSPTLRQLARVINDAFGSPIDEALLRAMVETCHQSSIATIGEPAPDEVLIKIVTEKSREVSQQPNLLYPKKVLVKAVTASFVGVPYEAYVEDVINQQMAHAQAKEREAEIEAARNREAAEAEARYEVWSRICDRHKTDQGYDMKAIAEDPEMDEKGREVARAQMERLGRFSQAPL
jgi:hypothetical protein